MIDERFAQLTPLIGNEGGLPDSGSSSARPPKQRWGTRGKSASTFGVVSHPRRFQAQRSHFHPTKPARSRRIVS